MTNPHVSQLKSQGRAVTTALESALASHRLFAERAGELIKELEQEATARESCPANDAGLHRLQLLEWLCSDIRADQVDWHHGLVGTAGSGPWPSDEFDSFLAGLGFELGYLPNPDLKCVVLGTEDWDEDDLADQVFDRDGSDLIVLSQPLFVAGLLKNTNPLASMDRSALETLAETHPALSFLTGRGFEWLFDEKLNRVTVWETTRELAEMSPLRLAGYSVAVNTGLTEGERRGILKEFFFASSPAGVRTDPDRARWGSAKSAQRLYGMATFLAWLCRYQGSNAPQAVERWKSDLGWLGREFFRPAMRFEWPVLATPTKPAQAFWTAAPSKPKTSLNLGAAWPFPNRATK